MPFCAHCGTQLAAVSYAPCTSCGSPGNGAPRPVIRSGGSSTTVIIVVVVLLVGISILGIMAAIAIPNLLTATQRSKQKRTMADVRTVATAVEAWATDQNKYPPAADMGTLAAQVEPTYVKTLPRLDGWGKPLRYECWSATRGDVCDSYAVWSSGKDGAFEQDAIDKYEGGATTNFNNDIVFSNGSFVRYPQGVQTGDK